MKTLLIKRASRDPLKAFFEYLTQNRIYDKYFQHAKEHVERSHYYEDMTNFFEDIIPARWIIRAFEWQEHEGFEYWRRYNEEWGNICAKNHYNKKIKLP